MTQHSSSQSWSARLAKLCRAKNIVVVSPHAVDHYTLSFSLQCVIVLVVVLVVAIASFSMGRHVHTQYDLVQTARQLQVTQAEHDKITSEFTLLKKDLLTLNADDQELSDYAQFVLDQYEQETEAVVEVDETLRPIGTSNSSTLLDRVNFLESELRRQRSDRKQLVKKIHQLTKGKVKVLEEALKITGVEDKMSSVIDSRVRKAMSDPDGTDAATAQSASLPVSQGGPFSPYDEQKDEASRESERALLADIVYLAEMQDVMRYLPLSRPMRQARFTSGFGKRIDPFRGRLANHEGIDYAGRMREPVLATAPGKVVYAGYKGAYGRTVDIDHGYGIVTRYAHLSRISHRVGTQVQRGQQIGTQGNTGRSTGHHLHYEIRYKGRALNPAKFIKAGLYVSKKQKQQG